MTSELMSSGKRQEGTLQPRRVWDWLGRSRVDSARDRELSSPLVSVCIPTHNGRRFIGETVRSVLGSSYSRTEVVICDDASSDGTLDEVRLFSDQRLRLVAGGTRIGPVANWNRALRSARGELLCLLNHDDLCGAFWLDVAARGLARFPAAGWAVSAFRVVDSASRTVSLESRFPASGVYSGTYPFLAIALMSGLGPAFVARRQVLEDLTYFDEAAGWGADNDLFLRLIARHPVFFSAVPQNAWRLHETNLTHSWPVCHQAREAARMLLAVVDDPQCPDWVRACRVVALRNLSQKLEFKAAQLARTGDDTSAQVLLGIGADLLQRVGQPV
ncbi:MAG: glycosyltransferase family 2 protein [Thermoanaerobaculaceae bacterium]